MSRVAFAYGAVPSGEVAIQAVYTWLSRGHGHSLRGTAGLGLEGSCNQRDWLTSLRSSCDSSEAEAHMLFLLGRWTR